MPTIREKDCPPDVLAKIMAHAPKEAKRGKRKNAEMVAPGIAANSKTVVILVAIETKNELNQRVWKAKNRRAGEAWRRVREAIGPSVALLDNLCWMYHHGCSLRVKFVRLGGRKLDLSGIAAACKGVEDAVAYLLGADDGDPRWKPEWDQEVGGLVGLRVEIEVA